MGAHLLSLSELCPALLHLASDACIARLTRTYLGRSLARSIRSLADEVQAALGIEPIRRPAVYDGDAGDLARFAGYAVMAVEHRCAAERETGVLMWSRLDPIAAAAPEAVDVLAEPGESPLSTELRTQAVMLLSDLRQGLRIEARYRPLPPDLDARLFGPLDAAIRRRRDRIERASRRSWDAAALGSTALEPQRQEEPSVGAGPIGR